MKGALVCLIAIVEREALRFISQRGRFFAALVRPLVWLVVFAAGFRAALGLSITPEPRRAVPSENGYDRLIARAAGRYGVQPALVKARVRLHLRLALHQRLLELMVERVGGDIVMSAEERRMLRQLQELQD